MHKRKYLVFGLGCFWAILLLSLLACESATADEEVAPTADFLLYNGKIYTMAADRRRVESIAIRQGKIICAGPERDCRQHAQPSTQLLDLSSRAVLPGLTDAHIHPISGGLRYFQCDLTDFRRSEPILEAVTAFAAAHPDLDWIRGAGLWLPSVAGGYPTAAMLDIAEAERPVFITSTDGHSAWVNSAALAIAGINAATPDPLNGRIERSADGQATGLLRESAMGLVSRYIPPTTRQERKAALVKAMEVANQHGIIRWIDASVDAEALSIYRELAAADSLSVDVILSLAARMALSTDAADDVDSVFRAQPTDDYEHLSAHSVKLFIDGVVEGKTAALLANYEGETFSFDPYLPAEEFNELVADFDQRGYQVHVHACGDLGVRMTLDAFEYARRTNGIRDSRHHIVHLQLMDPADIDRFRELDVTVNFQPLWATPEDTYISDLTIPVLGADRSEWIYPFGALAESGAVLAAGSDWPVTTINPFPAMQVAVTRRGPDTIVRPAWTPQHLLDRFTVLSAYTIGGAYLNFQENESGSLEVGKQADLIVLDQDLFAVPFEDLGNTQVDLTMLRGNVIYQSNASWLDQSDF
ncbi:MAG: amidohydrolase [Bacteroidota bacterium]